MFTATIQTDATLRWIRSPSSMRGTSPRARRRPSPRPGRGISRWAPAVQEGCPLQEGCSVRKAGHRRRTSGRSSSQASRKDTRRNPLSTIPCRRTCPSSPPVPCRCKSTLRASCSVQRPTITISSSCGATSMNCAPESWTWRSAPAPSSARTRPSGSSSKPSSSNHPWRTRATSISASRGMPMATG